MRQSCYFSRWVTLIILGAAVISAAPAGSEERTMNEEIVTGVTAAASLLVDFKAADRD